jgi:5'-nucleotidase
MASTEAAAAAPHKPIILVDMDDTVTQFTGRALALLAARHPNLVLPAADATTFPLADSFEPEQRCLVTALFKEPGYFREMEPIAGAVDALRAMVDAGYNVRLCTAPLAASPACCAEKAEWVIRHLGPSWIDRLVLTRDKTLVRGDVLIDDAPKAKGDALAPSWTHVYFSQPHNLPTAPGADASRLRLERWADWTEVVPKALALASGCMPAQQQQQPASQNLMAAIAELRLEQQRHAAEIQSIQTETVERVVKKPDGRW